MTNTFIIKEWLIEQGMLNAITYGGSDNLLPLTCQFKNSNCNPLESSRIAFQAIFVSQFGRSSLVEIDCSGYPTTNQPTICSECPIARKNSTDHQ